MAADFKNIKDVFESHHLQLPILRALIPDAEFYEVLAIQPEGIIETSGNFIGHSDRLSAQSKFSSFLSLAVEKVATWC